MAIQTSDWIVIVCTGAGWLFSMGLAMDKLAHRLTGQPSLESKIEAIEKRQDETDELLRKAGKAASDSGDRIIAALAEHQERQSVMQSEVARLQKDREELARRLDYITSRIDGGMWGKPFSGV